MMKATTGVLLFLFQITMANGSMITFDPPPCMVCNSQLDGYQEAGLVFTGNASHHNMTLDGSANNGSTGSVRFAFSGSISMQRADGDLFSLVGVELGEYSREFLGVRKSITFTGFLPGGTTSVAQTFEIDGTMDGPGGIDDFETFTFAREFREVVRVDISGAMIALDNLNLGTVPVPAAAWLFVSGLIALAGLSRRKIR